MPTLPDPQLAEAARVARRALDRYERGLVDITYRGQVLDIVVVADGLGSIVSVVVPAARIPAPGGTDASLPVWINGALHTALGEVRARTNQSLDQARPALPRTGPLPASIAHRVRTLLHDPYTGTAAGGTIVVTLAVDWTPSVAIANAFYSTPERLLLGDRVRDAANIALDRARQEQVCAAAGLARVQAECLP
jgi:hypothetical protein